MAKPAAPGGKAAIPEKGGDTTMDLVIWRDVVGREMKAMKRFDHSGGFVISDPRKLKSVTPKIGEVDKGHDPLAATRRAEEVESLKKTLADASRLPKEKYKLPLTASQEVGWFSQYMEPEPFKATNKTCDEVAFATRYFESEGKGLFHRDPNAGAAGGAKKAASPKK
jgi:FAM183A and FAM183B related